MSAVTLPDAAEVIHVPPGATWDGRWLVCFGEDWGRHNSTTQYLALALAAEHGASLVWVDSLGLREPRLNRTDAIRVIRRLGRWLRGEAHAGQGTGQGSGPGRASDIDLHVISPLALPFLRFRAVRRLNRIWVGRQLRRLHRRFGVTAPLVITACPATVDVLDCLDPVCRVYYCADEHAERPGMDATLVSALERELITRVDLVVASSRALVEKKGALTENVHYLPHGVDRQHFGEALSPDVQRVAELEALPRPRMGFVGLIGRHLDLDVIKATAEAVPHGSVVLVGPREDGLADPPTGKNIHYMGPRPYAELPLWLAGFDVCLLPWNNIPANSFAHPTKLREYIAAGCPVVASRHPEFEGLQPGVSITDNAADFVAAVKEIAMAPSSLADRRRIADAARGHDWSDRASSLSDLLHSVQPTARDVPQPQSPTRWFRQPPVAFRHRASDLWRSAWSIGSEDVDNALWGFSDGRSALLCLLTCLATRNPELRRVIVPAWTCWSVAAAIEYAGLEPVCCDVDPIALDLEPDDLVQCLRQPALAVIATHLLGAPPDLTRLASHPHAGRIIEDAAQADDPLAEPLPGAAARLVSAARGKPVAAGGGGWLRFADAGSALAQDLSDAWQRLPARGRSAGIGTTLAAAVGNLCLHPRLFALVAALPALEVGKTCYPERIDPARANGAQRALLAAGVERMATVHATRRRAAAEYASAIAPILRTRQPVITLHTDYAPYRFPAYLDRPLSEIESHELAVAARAGVVPMYPHTLADLEPARPWSVPMESPGALWIARRLVTLPTHDGIGACERRMALAALARLNGGDGNGRGR